VSAAEALEAARAAGVGLRVDGDELLLEASAPPPAAVLDLLARHKADVISLLQAADEAAFSERAAALEHDEGLPRSEAERLAANEQGFATPEALLAAVASGWAEHLRRLQAPERSPRGRQCIAAAVAFIEHGWALEALRCGWSELELVGACPFAPWERLDRLGAAYSMFTPIEVTAEAILYRSSGCTCTKWMARAIKWTPKGVKAPLRLLRGSHRRRGRCCHGRGRDDGPAEDFVSHQPPARLL
jgi:hypothetical protein